MLQYQLSGKKFTGEVVIFYRRGRLVKIDFSDAELTEQQLGWLLKNMSLDEDHLSQMMTLLSDCHLIQSDYEVTLEDFKREYPYQRNSHLLPPIWDKMKSADKVQAVEQGHWYRKYCDRNEWYKPKIAAKWLKDREYLNNWKKM